MTLKERKKKIAQKMVKEPLKDLLKEHKRLVPELKEAGLKKEAKIQDRELKEYEDEGDHEYRD